MERTKDIPGAPVGWKQPGATRDWKMAKPKTKKGKPTQFEQIDNPDNWPPFAYHPKFKATAAKNKKKGTYEATRVKGKKTKTNKNAKDTRPTMVAASKHLYHSLPIRVTPVPLTNGKREVENYAFNYDGWVNDRTPFCDGATRDNLFLQACGGSLDRDMLHYLGLTLSRMEEPHRSPDALFFHQLMLPICNIDNEKLMTVTKDPHKCFYSNVSRWSNLYAAGELGILGGGYGHDCLTTNPAEVMKWDGTVLMDGLLGTTRISYSSMVDNTTQLLLLSTITRNISLTTYYHLTNPCCFGATSINAVLLILITSLSISRILDKYVDFVLSNPNPFSVYFLL